ncbi:MAG: cation:proton antiporter [Phycisphaeraceae bacterium]|nr:cation:proton antiporter [Phycisphaeraceae bacterium]
MHMLATIAPVDLHHLPIILIMGLAIFMGTIGARLFQKLRIPQVVGYIVIGLIIGEPCLKIITSEVVGQMETFNMFALGIIGFMIGGELKLEIFRKYGKQFMAILFSEGLFTFALVSVAVTLACRVVLPDANWHLSIAMGLVLGAISSATAPAATVDVFWEYKTRGPLTRTILAIVALDDGLALLIFGFASSVASSLIGKGESSLLMNIVTPCYEILGAVAVGLITGLVLVFVLKYILEPEKILAFTLASVMLIIGLSHTLHVDSILAAMALGATIANGLPRRSKSTFELVEKFAPPIYVLFFVLVGAGMQLGLMNAWVITIAVVYVVTRTLGKFIGAWFGATLSKAPRTVRQYAGLCLFSQAGVAVGLSIVAGHRFEGIMGEAIVLIITATTFLVQIIGPSCVKVAVHKAGEANKNITDKDLIKSYCVSDVMSKSPITMPESLPLEGMLNTFSNSDALYFPVVNKSQHLLGVVTVDSIKESFVHQENMPWALAYDMMLPVADVCHESTPLDQALKQMKSCNQDCLCVVEEKDQTLLGVLNARKVRRKVNAELLRRQEAADEQDRDMG